ncbi:MAG: hypothetical protein ACOCWR_08605 [Oceanidesulfovibrio sp.]
MHDDKGHYYYPNPADKTVRMYVRENPDAPGEVEFRLHSAQNPEIWERHPWLSRDVAAQAAKMYDKPDRDPLALYDQGVARALLRIK